MGSGFGCSCFGDPRKDTHGMKRSGVQIICRGVAAAGFKLTGVDVQVVQDVESSGVFLDRAVEDDEVAIVITEREIYDHFVADKGVQWKQPALPIIVPFPGPQWRQEVGESHLIDLLRRAIGYRIKL